MLYNLLTPSGSEIKLSPCLLQEILDHKEMQHRSLSNNIYYIKLDNNTLLVMYKTPENEAVLNKYQRIYYIPEDPDLLYWFNFQNNNTKNLGYNNKDTTIRTSKQPVVNNRQELRNNLGHSSNYNTYYNLDLKKNKYFMNISYWFEGDSGFSLKIGGNMWYSAVKLRPFTTGVNFYFDDDMSGSETVDMNDIFPVIEIGKLYFINLQYNPYEKKVIQYLYNNTDNVYYCGEYTMTKHHYLRAAYKHPYINVGGDPATARLYDIKFYGKPLSAYEVNKIYLNKFNYPPLRFIDLGPILDTALRPLHWFNFENGNLSDLVNSDNKILYPEQIMNDGYKNISTSSVDIYQNINLVDDVVTYCFWVMSTNHGNSYWAIGLRSPGDWNGRFVLKNDARIFIGEGSYYVTIDDLVGPINDLNKLYFMTMQYDGLQGKIYLTIKTANNYNYFREFDVNTDKDTINSYLFNGPKVFYWENNGGNDIAYLYDTKIYNKLLTTEEINNIYAYGSNLKRDTLKEAYAGNGDYIALTNALIYENKPDIISSTSPLLESHELYVDDNQQIQISDTIYQPELNWKQLTTSGDYSSVYISNGTNPERIEVVLKSTGRGSHIYNGSQNNYADSETFIYLESDVDGKSLGVTSDNRILEYVDGTAVDISYGLSFIWVSRGLDGTIWAINTSENPYLYNGTDGWDLYSGGLSQISVANADHIVARNSNDTVYVYNQNGNWRGISGHLVHNVSIGEDTVIYGVNKSNDLWKYEHHLLRWTFIRHGVKQVSYKPPYICILNTTDNVEIATIS